MTFRHCAGRVTTDLLSYACGEEGQVCCSDGRWRCVTHARAFERKWKGRKIDRPGRGG